MKQRLVIGLIAIIASTIYFSVFIVDQRQRALLFRLGEIIRTDIKPGLHFKYPLINNVERFDTRILTLNARPESFLTVEKKNVTVDFFVKWRIEKVDQYYRSTRGDERNAQSRLSQIVKDGLRNEFGKRTIQQAVSGERNEIMNIIRQKTNSLAKDFGIQVVDVRISRIDLPDDVSGAVYARMRAERNRVARDFRARGMEKAEKIRANADRERIEIVSDAYKESEKIRGEGDAKSAKIYADAYRKNPELYSFLRSMEAYKKVFGSGDTFVLEPDSEFFNYFNSDLLRKKK